MTKVYSRNRFMYDIENMINDKCAFRINLDREFAERLQSLPAESEREQFSEFVTDNLVDHDFADVQFSKGGFLLTNITVAWDATGLDLTKKERIPDEVYVYDTHNVDTSAEVIDILTVFTTWANMAHTLIT